MSASVSARRRQLQERAGDLGVAKVEPGRKGLTYKVSCTECTERGRRWNTVRHGHGNGYVEALDRWALHLHWSHPGEDAPCLDLLQSARRRAAERRVAEAKAVDALYGGMDAT